VYFAEARSELQRQPARRTFSDSNRRSGDHEARRLSAMYFAARPAGTAATAGALSSATASAPYLPRQQQEVRRSRGKEVVGHVPRGPIRPELQRQPAHPTFSDSNRRLGDQEARSLSAMYFAAGSGQNVSDSRRCLPSATVTGAQEAGRSISPSAHTVTPYTQNF
jgi:hypothetical protein